MKAKKILTMSLLAVLTAVSLTGCKDSKKGNSDKTIEIWHVMGKNNLELVQTMTDAFLKLPENKGWTINFLNQGGYTDIYSNLLKAIPGRNLPTMAMCYPDHVADYLAQNVVEDMTGRIAASNEENLYNFNSSDYIDAFWQEGAQQVKDGMYSVPFSKSTEVLFYNKSFFAKHNLTVPTTWDEMEALCAQILQIDEVKKTSDYAAPLGYDSDDNLFITFCEQLGIPYTSVDKSTCKGSFDFNNDDAKNMVATVKRWYQSGYITTKGILGNNTYTSTKFTEQKLHMTIGSTGGTSYDYPKNDAFEVGVAPLPQWRNSADPKCILQGPSFVFFNKYGTHTSSAKVDFAWKWYTYVTNPTNSAAYAILTGYEPVRKSSYQEPTYAAHLAGNEHVYYATSAAELKSVVANTTQDLQDWYFTSPVFVGSGTARESVGGIIPAVCASNDPNAITTAFEAALTACSFAAMQ